MCETCVVDHARYEPEWRKDLRKKPAPRLTEPVATNVDIVGYSDMNGRPDGLQVQVQEVGGRFYLYVGHVWSGGISVLDVTDPAAPEVVAFVPTPNEHTWHVKIQVADGILMAACEAAFFSPTAKTSEAWLGCRFFDVSNPRQPRELSFWEGSKPPGFGVHRSWWNGGRYAYLAHGVAAPGVSYHWRTGRTRVMTILDLEDPENPKTAADFFHPVQSGEAPPALPDETFGVHMPCAVGDRAYVAYSDGGFAVVDIADASKPTLISHVRTFPTMTDGQTHSIYPIPEREILVVSEEPLATFGLEGPKNIRLWDISDETHPQLISTLPHPVPTEREPYETYYQKGERFGPHNLHENHQGSAYITDKVYNAYFNAGLRIWDISDAANPFECASFVPPDPEVIVDPRPHSRIFDVVHGGVRGLASQDVIVDTRGYIYLSDYNAGLWIVKESAS